VCGEVLVEFLQPRETREERCRAHCLGQNFVLIQHFPQVEVGAAHFVAATIRRARNFEMAGKLFVVCQHIFHVVAYALLERVGLAVKKFHGIIAHIFRLGQDLLDDGRPSGSGPVQTELPAQIVDARIRLRQN